MLPWLKDGSKKTGKRKKEKEKRRGHNFGPPPRFPSLYLIANKIFTSNL
jgi:hypothetical protein